MHNLKIFVIGTRGFPGLQGGVEKHCEELYPRLYKLGCNVTVFARKPYFTDSTANKEWNGIKFIYLPTPRSQTFEAFFHTFFSCVVAVSKHPDVIHIHAIGPALFTPMAKLFGTKVVMTNHGPDYQRQKWGRLAKLILRLGEFFGITFADRVIVLSKELKQMIKEKYKKEHTTVIPNGVSMPVTITPGKILEKYNLKPRGYVLAVGRFVPEKGFSDLISAYIGIANPKFKLVIVGGADHETVYSQGIKKMADQAPGMILTGFLSGVPLAELYSNAGLFVLPSSYEGMPIALLEAMSYGLPVLVSDIPANRQIPLPDFRFFPVGEIEELSRKLSDLFRRGISTEELQAQKELLLGDYNWDKIADKTFNIYKSLIV